MASPYGTRQKQGRGASGAGAAPLEPLIPPAPKRARHEYSIAFARALARERATVDFTKHLAASEGRGAPHTSPFIDLVRFGPAHAVLLRSLEGVVAAAGRAHAERERAPPGRGGSSASSAGGAPPVAPPSAGPPDAGWGGSRGGFGGGTAPPLRVGMALVRPTLLPTHSAAGLTRSAAHAALGAHTGGWLSVEREGKGASRGGSWGGGGKARRPALPLLATSALAALAAAPLLTPLASGSSPMARNTSRTLRGGGSNE